MANGPVKIGVATTVVPKRRTTANGKVIRPSVHYVRLATAAAREGAILYLFHPHAVNWSRGYVDAWLPRDSSRPSGDWVKRRVEVPDVIYENVFVHLAIAGYTASLRRAAQSRNIPLFNPLLPGKWRMVEILKRQNLADYSPQTERLQDAEQAMARIRAWGTAYIKPSGGYGGMDVARVEQMSNGRYQIALDRSKTKNGKVRLHLSEAEFRRWINQRLKRAHLIQRELRLITVRGRKVDFRVVLHRDLHGDWQLIGIVPKMAAVGGVVTNLIAGGELLDIEYVRRLAQVEGKYISLELLERRAKEVAQIISRRYPYTGHVGFDMAVEEDMSVSMIEMNAKPSRKLLNKQMLQRLATHTAGFAIYLARRRTSQHKQQTNQVVTR
ncbi:YheC/YheD family protein [Alicyclobacillus fodiniaquatilis]|uniref:YheC/YheD family protein n=1 Tax=Alicyclobacillus fodiniaquatilis TaxID=1661150 RepID=A0ABW4JNN6_9BACL